MALAVTIVTVRHQWTVTSTGMYDAAERTADMHMEQIFKWNIGVSAVEFSLRFDEVNK